MQYKGFDVPKDTALFIKTFLFYLCFKFRLKREASDKIITDILFIHSKSKKYSKQKQISYFVKIYKLASFFTAKFFKSNKPCLIRSLIIFNEAKKSNHNVRMVIGVKKNNEDLEGHSWIVLEGSILLESAQDLSEYTIMKEY